LISLFVFHIGFIEVSWIDIIDVMLVTLLLYQLYKWMKGSIAEKIFLGVLSIYLLYLLVRALKMELLTTILGQFIGVGMIAALILFQQEIRRFLLMVGKTTSFRDSLRRLFFWKKYSEAEEWLAKAARLGPKNPNILEHYGDVLYKLNRAGDALIQWNAAKDAGGNSEALLKKIKDKKLND